MDSLQPPAAHPDGAHGADGLYGLLLACAAQPGNPVTLALAGVMAQQWGLHGSATLPLAGLDGRATCQLLAHWFPGAEHLLGLDCRQIPPRAEPRQDEIDDLVSLLLPTRAPGCDPQRALEVALVLANASLGDNHLWQDLHLPARAYLSELIATWFPEMAARNHSNMKWKKFFYRQLCEREEILICRSPSCAVCTDHALCFGSEEAATPLVSLAHLRRLS